MTDDELAALSDEELAIMTLEKVHELQMAALSENMRSANKSRRKACILFLQQGARASLTTFNNAEEAARKLRGA